MSISQISKLNDLFNEINLDINPDQISGPVSAYVGYDDTIKFIIFGDRHNSTSNKCTRKCNTISNNKIIEHNDKCWEISSLIWKIFEENQDKSLKFFLEIPFIDNNFDEISVREMLIRSSENHDFLTNIKYVFYDCFLRKNICPFKNVEFQYSDIRQTHNNDQIKENIISIYIQDKLNEFIKLMINILEGTRENNESDILLFLELDILITNFFYSKAGELPKFIQYFNLCVLSDDFVNDVGLLFNDMYEELQSENIPAINIIKTLIINPSLILNREGKTRHRIRYQFFSMKGTENALLIEKIIRFYTKYINIEYIAGFYGKIWELIRNIYMNIIDGNNEPEDISILHNISNSLKTKDIYQKIFYEGYLFDIYVLGLGRPA